MVLLDRMVLEPYPKVRKGGEPRCAIHLQWVRYTGSPPHLPRSGMLTASSRWEVVTASTALLSCIIPKLNLGISPTGNTWIVRKPPKRLGHHAKHIQGLQGLGVGLVTSSL